MKIKHNKQTDTIYIKFNGNNVNESETIKEGFIIDYDENGKIVGIEIINVSEKIVIE